MPPIHDGTGPVNQLPDRYSTSSLGKTAIQDGTGPVNSLPCRYSSRSSAKPASSGGISPDSPLDSRSSSTTRRGRSSPASGSCPLRVTPSHFSVRRVADQFNPPPPARLFRAASSVRQSATSPGLAPGSATAPPAAHGTPWAWAGGPAASATATRTSAAAAGSMAKRLSSSVIGKLLSPSASLLRRRGGG